MTANRFQVPGHHDENGEARMKIMIARFVAEESGATAIEYAIIASGISIAIVATVWNIGSQLNTLYGNVSNGFK